MSKNNARHRKRETHKFFTQKRKSGKNHEEEEKNLSWKRGREFTIIYYLQDLRRSYDRALTLSFSQKKEKGSTIIFSLEEKVYLFLI